MYNFIFIFSTVITLIVPPINQFAIVREPGLPVTKVALVKALPASPRTDLGTLNEVYVAPVVEPAPVAPVAPVTPVTPAVVVSNDTSGGCGDNAMAHYIYMHESGCRTNALNEIGACGIGQALPCGKMGCSLSDYACQNAFFTTYAMSRYGSWEGAYNFWLANRYW